MREDLIRALSFRAATMGDIDAIVAMVNEAYRKTEGHIFPGTTRTQRTSIAGQMDGLAVADDAGRIVGCVYVKHEADRGHFGLLAADVREHGRGIGTALIAQAESVALGAGCRVMHMEAVKEANLIPFYERRGYRVVRETPGQEWNGGEDWGAAIDWHMVDLEKDLQAMSRA
jgi:GNAT superfamily N-acetyltransferase